MIPKERPATPSISCVMPAYNEAQNLPVVLPQVVQALAALTPHWELIVVDDGSRDATPAAIAPLLEQQPGLRYLRLARNFGKEAALTAGMDHAHGDVVLLIDADGQHPVALLPQMLDAWRDGADMVCTARASRADEGWVKRLGTKLFYAVVNWNPQVQIPVDAGDFRLMDRRVVDVLRRLPERNRFMKGLYAWVGFDTRVIEYQPSERLAGHSSFSMRSLARLAFTGITAFSNLPLRLWSGLGALVAFAALAYGLYIVVQHLVAGHDVPGWATLVTALAFFSGVQLLSIGIIGEYIGRIFDEVKRRPIYVVAGERGRGLEPGPVARPALPAE